MLSGTHRSLRWLPIAALVFALAIFGGAGYVLNQGTAANAAAPSAPVHVASVDPSGLKPGEAKVLPNGVTVRLDSHHDLSPPLRDIPPAAAQPKQEAPENGYPFRAPT